MHRLPVFQHLMASKSQAKAALLEHCKERAQETGYNGEPFERRDNAKLPANMVLIDGFVLMDAQGHGCSLPTLRETTMAEITHDDSQDESGTDRSSMPETDPDLNFAQAGRDPDGANRAFDMAESAHQRGQWRHFTANIRRVLEKALERPGVAVVVFGFDKKQFVDKVKSITHMKRGEERKRAREKQQKRDQAVGLADTRGIPFTFEDIAPGKLMPYPWTQVRGSSAMLTDVMRYICLDICKNVQLPEYKSCTLILDGHNLQPEDLKIALCPDAPETSPTVPIVISQEGVGNAVALENRVGEFDHTMFHYISTFLKNPVVGSMFNFCAPTSEIPSVVRLRTNDTDAFLFGLVYQEYMVAEGVNMQLAIEYPGKFGKTDSVINLAPVERLLAGELQCLRWPAASAVYALFLKSNDYDTPFLNGIGHRTLLNALVNHAPEIGDLVDVHEYMARKLQLPDHHRVMLPDAMHRLIMAACVQTKHFARIPKHLKQDAAMRRLKMHQKLAEYKRVTYRELCLATRRANLELPTTRQVLEKWLRHIFFISINEDLMLARTRSISSDRIKTYGYCAQ